MLAIPVPFVVALVLAILIGLVVTRNDGRSALPIVVFLAATLAQAVLVGLRWSLDWPATRLIQPLGAAAVPMLALWVVAGLTGGRGARILVAVVAGGAATAALVAWWRQPIDALLVGLYVGAGAAILAVALGGADRFGSARLGDVGRARFAALALGLLLLGGALVDVLVGAELYPRGPTDEARRVAAQVVSIGNLVVLLTVAVAAVVIGGALPAADDPGAEGEAAETTGPKALPASGVPDADADPDAGPDDGVSAEARRAADLAVIAEVELVLKGRALYRDPDLSLDRLARRVHRPARAISGAVNRVHGINVSQWVNGFRIDDARRLLVDTDLPVTAILHEVGFQTKSNFHREFARVVGCSPREWRARARAAMGGAGSGSDGPN